MNKITIKGKVKIIERDDYKEVIKPKSKDLSTLFDYLDSRGFVNHPKIIKEEDDVFRYEYVSSNGEDDTGFINVVGDLHYKTCYFKDVSVRKHKDIYNKLIDKVDFIRNGYSVKIENIDNEKFMSPSNYLFARNYSIFLNNLNYIEKELNSWYGLVKDVSKERVSVVHNNLRIDNFLSSENSILTGWDSYLVDTPILDIYKLYKNEFSSLDMVSLFKEYYSVFKLNDMELKLFYILISFPPSIDGDSELERCRSVKRCLEYLFKTSDFINHFLKEGIEN